jgi:hypothetical protein
MKYILIGSYETFNNDTTGTIQMSTDTMILELFDSEKKIDESEILIILIL